MAETDKTKANRLQRWREKRRLKRERTGDTPQAMAERQRQAKQYDDDALRKIGEGAIGG